MNPFSKNVATVILERLAQHGVSYLMGNAGTDFPPVIEAFAEAEAGMVPEPMTVPHENLAVAVAHGCYLATGQAQAVMLHVNVGTANALCGILNARKDRIPIVVMAGRTPIHESGVFGARTVNIHWGQEMFDQAGMVREAVKWDYELRSPEQVIDVVDRALRIAKQQPGGPVYLTLPREVIAADAVPAAPRATSPNSRNGVDPARIRQAAEILSAAKRPVLITSAFGRDPAEMNRLEGFLERHQIGAVAFRPRYLPLSTTHPCHLGFEPGYVVDKADCLITFDCDVPWIPSIHKPDPNVPIIQIDMEPDYPDFPIRSFPATCVVSGDPAFAIAALDSAMDTPESVRADRQDWLGKQIADITSTTKTSVEGTLLTAQHVAQALDDLLSEDDILLTEAPFPISRVRRTKPGTYFGTSSAGGLGWGLGAALGLKLGLNQRFGAGANQPRVVAAIGDGSYMFGNPTPAHFMARAYDLPTLTIILNNKMWGAVRRATLSMYEGGAARKTNSPALTRLDPSPDYEKIVEANGGWGARVETEEELVTAIQEGLDKVTNERIPAVLNVHTHYDDETAAADAKR